jgi:alpha/beta superfamily hydrolase
VLNFDTAAVPADTLVVHGELDDVVPLAAVFDWARPQALPVTVLPGAGHFFHGQLSVLKHIVTSAFAWHPAP